MDHYKLTIDAYNKLAKRYEDKFMNFDLYNDTYDVFCRLIEKSGSRIFEIGCGPGNITRYLQLQRPDFLIEGIDAAPEMVKLAKANNPSARFEVMDCREIDKITDCYDGIICGFCMPYLSKDDCFKLIKDCSYLLHSSGIVYLSAIEGDYEKSGYETSSDGEIKMYVYYHQQDYIEKALRDNSFQLEKLIRKEYTKSDGSLSTHMIFIACKK